MQLFNVYSPKYDTGGRFWPIVHSTTIFSLVLLHIIAIGVFGLKKLPLASSLLVPLPVLTLLFNEFCRKRFLPIFKAYSSEVLLSVSMCSHKNYKLMTLVTMFFGCPYMAYNAAISHINFFNMQSLIKKDREEQSKPEMTEFFNNLATAYCDPALKPIQRSLNSNEHTAPLLSSG